MCRAEIRTRDPCSGLLLRTLARVGPTLQQALYAYPVLSSHAYVNPLTEQYLNASSQFSYASSQPETHIQRQAALHDCLPRLLEIVYGEEKNILYWADQSSQGRIGVSCTGTTSQMNQPRKDPFHLYSLNPHSPQFQQSFGATPLRLSDPKLAIAVHLVLAKQRLRLSVFICQSVPSFINCLFVYSSFYFSKIP